MARLLIASRSMALALRLADMHEIVEHSPDELDQLLPGEDVDAVVLDVGDPQLAVDAVKRLRGLGYETPVLLVSGYQHEWSGVGAMGLPDVKVVPLPITRVALLEGLGYLTGSIVDLSGVPPTPDAVPLPPAGADSVPVIGGGEPDGEDPADGPARPGQGEPGQVDPHAHEPADPEPHA